MYRGLRWNSRQRAKAIVLLEDWSEDSRYEPRGQKEAEDLLVAVSDLDHGVLSCIKRYW